MKLFSLFYLTLCVFLLCTCSGGEEADVVEKAGEDNIPEQEDKAVIMDTTDVCVECEWVYALVPLEPLEFDSLYAYPYGVRYDESCQEIQNYIDCLYVCFDFQRLLMAVKLSARLKYDADAPSCLKYFLFECLVRNPNQAENVYEALSCKEFAGHIRFVFSTVEGGLIPKYDSTYPKKCNFFQSLELGDACKEQLVEKYCD